jgi:hypothetical protein
MGGNKFLLCHLHLQREYAYTCTTLVTRSIGVSKERKIFVGLF